MCFIWLWRRDAPLTCWFDDMVDMMTIEILGFFLNGNDINGEVCLFIRIVVDNDNRYC